MKRIGQAAAAVFLGAACIAAVPDDLNGRQCAALKNQGVTPEQKIAACTALIDAGTLQGEGLGLVLARRGDGNYFAGRLAASIADYNAAMAIYGQPGGSSAMLTGLIEARGHSYGDGGRYALALADFDSVLDKYPARANARFGRARALALLGFATRARDDLDKAILQQPNLVEAYVARAAVSLMISDVPHAIQDIDYALLVAPDHAGAYYNRGLAYYAVGQFDLAIRDFDHALALTSGDPFAGEVTRADAIKARDNAGKALEAWQAALAAPMPPAPPVPPGQVAPSRAVGATHDCTSRYPDISRVLAEQGDVVVRYDVDDKGAVGNVVLVRSSGSDRLDRAALACVSTLWRNTPASRDAVPIASPGHQAMVRFVIDGQVSGSERFDFVGQGWTRVGDLDRAMAAFDHAIELAPKSAEAHYHRGLVEYFQGQFDRAIADFDSAIAQKPDYRDAQDARTLAKAERPATPGGHAI